MDIELIQLMLLFFAIAVFYSSAGFGGGSSYLAILALFPLSFTSIRIIALLCNIVVVSGTVYLMYKKKYLNIKKTIPLILMSVPLAYIGGKFKIHEDTFFILLGITLFLSSLMMLFFSQSKKQSNLLNLPLYSNGIIGALIGFLSGIVGIGGGIFLSPILHLTRWDKAITIAATTALFILVNSISGLVGQISTNGFAATPIYAIALMASVFLGGQIGIRITINKLNPLIIKRVTALLILIVAIRILYKYLIL